MWDFDLLMIYEVLQLCMLHTFDIHENRGIMLQSWIMIIYEIQCSP